MKNILIAGGSGLVGTRLSFMLQEKGYEVSHLSRRSDPGATFPTYHWDLDKKQIDPAALSKADAIINLAGAGVADARWTEARKRLIIESRTGSALLLKSFIENKKTPAQTYLSASAIGYYGNRGNQLLRESDPPGQTGFLAHSVVEWEKAIAQVAATGIRTVAFRIGIVLSTKGGALEKMLLPFKFFNATYFGDGSMYYSWIHIDDMARLFVEALENPSMQGTFNAVAPNPATNKEIILACKKALGKPALVMPAPAIALRTAMGEMADMILDSARVSSEKVENAGFLFQYPDLLDALRDLIANGK